MLSPFGSEWTLTAQNAECFPQSSLGRDARMRKPATIALLFLAALCPADGQVTTATFYGVLTDTSGARIPGAAVTFVNEGTGAVSKQVADPAGEFGFEFLPVGSYT